MNIFKRVFLCTFNGHDFSRWPVRYEPDGLDERMVFRCRRCGQEVVDKN